MVEMQDVLAAKSDQDPARHRAHLRELQKDPGGPGLLEATGNMTHSSCQDCQNFIYHGGRARRRPAALTKG